MSEGVRREARGERPEARVEVGASAAAPHASSLRAAVVQMDVAIGEVEVNLARVLDRVEAAADAGAMLVVFPECALTGYCFDSLEEARPATEAGTRALHAFATRCRDRGVTGLIGTLLAERGTVYNAAVLAGPDGGVQFYRKTHLPTLGIDRFVAKGPELRVLDGAGARIGVLICYDLRFPEAARCLTVIGAEILAVPTNWPDGAESSPEYVTRARARENGVYVLAANRVGTERATHFIGCSQVVAPHGEILAQAGATEETVLYADIDLEATRRKRIVLRPGEWEMDTVGDRRPELYGALVEP